MIRRSLAHLCLSCIGLCAALAPAAASEVSVSGTVLELDPRATYDVWLTDTPDLTAPHLPLASQSPDPTSGRFELRWDSPGDRPPLWVFLRQRIPAGDNETMVFYLPWSRLPLDVASDARPIELRSLPVNLAQMQRGGGMKPAGWWQPPATLTLVLLVGVPLLWLVARHRRKRLGPAAGPPRAPPSLPAVTPRERKTVWALLGVATVLRVLRFGESLELLEHTYGPSLPGVREAAGPPLWELVGRLGQDPEAGAEIVRSVMEPPWLIVTHPPIYHWILTALGTLGGPDWILRVPALLFGLATLVVLWRLFRRVAPAAGIAAAAGWAVCAPGVFYGGDATPYALVGFVCAASVLFALRALEDGRSRAWALWIGALAVGFLSHYTTAIFGILQCGVIGVLLLRHHRDPRWMAATANLLKVVPAVGLAPVLWTWPHFATFEIVGLDTRLMAESYLQDPGFAVFGREVLAVLCSVSPNAWWLALPVLLLVGRGLQEVWRTDRVMAALVAANLVAGILAVVFFYRQHLAILNGRMFYGFRWISWLVPVAVGVGAASFARGGGGHRWPLRVLAGVWIVATLHFGLSDDARSTRPDYSSAADVIASDLQDHDGIATIPMWGQRGPLIWYVSQRLGFDVRQPGIELPRRVFLNPTHEQLPFETSAWNGHVDRLWVARVDEQMFGRPKFDLDQADQALAWARANLDLGGEWHFDHLDLYRFDRDQRGAWDGREPLVIRHPQVDPTSLRYQEPNKWFCGQKSEFAPRMEDDPNAAQAGWSLYLRVPLAEGVGSIEAEVTEGAISGHDEPGFWVAEVIGGRCEHSPPLVRLTTAP